MLLSGRGSFLLPCLAVVAALAIAPRAADAYKNYTVGDDKGWYDGLALPGVDYQEWADGKNFSLGDFLIFNTDKNHSVVQTRNGTLYKSCDYNDSGPDDTVEWSAAAPEFSKDAVTVAVPLLKEGRTYFFSGNYDGEQCENGQRFAIDVAHGQGLPPDLRSPAADAPAPSAGPAAADGAAVLDFSHPKNVTTPSASDDDPSSSSGGSTSVSSRTLVWLGPGLAVTLGAVLFAV
ncbi:early nodulin-like protein 18 [Phragmites australis]|uniref:early nodulin-like protein 18 n=1 Tax=Phragmites australis TaxID=29695 RepID=UPI002D7664A5|nr:early nodulin-like protein 18 [Phragmites australis]